MASAEEMSIALPTEMAAIVRQAVEDGEYASSDEVIRDALSDWTQKRSLQQISADELQAIWQKAISNEAPGIPAEEVLDRLEKKYQAMVDSDRR